MQWSTKSEDIRYFEKPKVFGENQETVDQFRDLLRKYIGTLVSNKIRTNYWIPETKYFGEKFYAYSDKKEIHHKCSLFPIMKISETPEERKKIEDFLNLSGIDLKLLLQNALQILEIDLKPLGFFIDYRNFENMNESELYSIIPAISICDARLSRHLIKA